MSPEAEILGEKVATIERHLRRVVACLPENPAELAPMTDMSDAVILHLWQAVQIVVDLAIATCVRLGLGSPPSYGDAFRRLAAAGHLDVQLAERLVRAAGFRNVVAHAYDTIDMSRVHRAAKHGPTDLRAFLAALAKLRN